MADKLRRFQNPNGEPYTINGDPAYGLTGNVLAPYRGVRLTDDQHDFNSQMNKVRTCVEWGFRKINQLFAFLDFEKNLKFLLHPIGNYYLVAVTLVNCHTWLYGFQTGTYFVVDQTTLEPYLSNHEIPRTVVCIKHVFLKIFCKI